jgi:hypothetical protein
LTALQDPGPPVAFDVIDALAGAARLTRRSATLDGSVPLRVAQACVPLLEGNAFGHQVVLRDRVTAERSLGRWSVQASDAAVAMSRLARAVLPTLVARGLIDDDAAARLRDCWPIETGFRRALRLWTGLLLRPRAGVALRVSSTANRRPRGFTVHEARIDDPARYEPLLLELAPVDKHLSLGGEVATVAALPLRPPRFDFVALDGASSVVAAHAAFYGGAYFATKRGGEVARTYKALVRRRRVSPADHPDEAIEVTAAGPATIVAAGRTPRAADRLIFRNGVPFTARFDGQRVDVTPDAGALRRFSASVRATWRPVKDQLGDALHEGAVHYFAKYFTSHPPGEPHFFVKPPALVRTEPGTSLLLEGAHGPGWDVLRGVVQTDVFHAAPAVFQLWSGCDPVSIPEGTPLLEMFAVPRSLIGAGFAASVVEPGA